MPRYEQEPLFADEDGSALGDREACADCWDRRAVHPDDGPCDLCPCPGWLRAAPGPWPRTARTVDTVRVRGDIL